MQCKKSEMIDRFIAGELILLIGDMVDHGCLVVSSFTFVVCRRRCKMNDGFAFCASFFRNSLLLAEKPEP